MISFEMFLQLVVNDAFGVRIKRADRRKRIANDDRIRRLKTCRVRRATMILRIREIKVAA
jgi:hypothetical protein